MPRPDSSKQLWIEKGYEHFALYGPEKMSINAISKEIGSPRASFYHHFSDMEVFINFLLEAHVEMGKTFIHQGKESCKQLIPDLYELLEKFQLGLKFNRKLFLNRHIPLYGYVFANIYEQSAKEFIIDLFIKEYDLNLAYEDANKLWLTFTETWYTRISPNKLDANEMQNISVEIMESIMKLMSSDLFAKLR